MHDRFVLLKRERDLSDKEALNLSGWVRNYDELGLAYRLKEDFFKIYDTQSPDEAQGRYIEWKRQITPEIAPAFADLVRAWDNWTPWILGYFDHPVTNAYTESLNNLIRVMNRLGRGYSFEALRAKILFAEGAMKKTNSRPKFERKREESPKVAFSLGYAIAENSMCRSAPSESFARVIATPSPSTQMDATEKNYGVDISTLARLIEEDQL